jgi:hypothetical protein
MSWRLLALGSAFFASLTASFGKLGEEDLNAKLATLIRTVVVIVMTAGIARSQHDARPSGGLTRRSSIGRGSQLGFAEVGNRRTHAVPAVGKPQSVHAIQSRQLARQSRVSRQGFNSQSATAVWKSLLRGTGRR